MSAPEIAPPRTPPQPARTRAELDEFLSQLDPPAPGLVRLYRGQSRGYVSSSTGWPSLLPALVRPGATGAYDPSWLVSVERFIDTELGLRNDLPMDMVRVWAPALLQHYGPGSQYLDITADLDVALWFALHEHHETWIAVRTGASAHAMMQRWYRMAWHMEVSGNRPPSSSAPVLYVFDAPLWSGAGLPAHGDAVDLIALTPGGRLGEKALRLQRQRGSLMFADNAAPGGPDLGRRLTAFIRMHPDFEDAAVRARGVADVFPPPGDDPFYRALLEVPACRQFNPERMQHPLSPPCYLTGVARAWESSGVHIASGSGASSSPLALEFTAIAADIAGLDEVQRFVETGTVMNPPFLYPLLTGEAANLPGPGFERALPLLLEAPVLTFLPGVEQELDRGMWLESALAAGVADQLDGQPSNDVYIELSPLDVWYPGQDDPKYAVLAFRLKRDAPDYHVTIFVTSPDGVFSHSETFHYDTGRGRFDAQTKPAPDFEWLQTRALKSLLTGLTVLRDLSPAFKAPAVQMLAVPWQGLVEYLPGSLMEPALAMLASTPGTPCRIVKSRSGGVYARGYVESYAQEGLSQAPADPMVEIAALTTFAAQVREPSYRVLTNAALVEKRASRGNFEDARSAAMAGLTAARAMKATPVARMFEAQMQILLGRILTILHLPADAREALSSAAGILGQLEASGEIQSDSVDFASIWLEKMAGIQVARSAAAVPKL